MTVRGMTCCQRQTAGILSQLGRRSIQGLSVWYDEARCLNRHNGVSSGFPSMLGADAITKSAEIFVYKWQGRKNVSGFDDRSSG